MSVSRRHALKSGVALGASVVMERSSPAALAGFGERPVISSAAPLLTLEDYERAARARVDRVAWEYISIGAADEISLRWNVDAYRSLSATCMYGSAGVYTVRATVSDEDGGTSAAALYRYVVVFDADGGSVTAGGFYDIPGQGRRKAHFTFSARFLLPGQSTAPKGR